MHAGTRRLPCIRAHRCKAGLAEALTGDYQLVVLDIMLPVQNGYEVLARLRKSSHVPVLMLNARDSEADKVCGLRMSADDYLTKPFSNSEFLARVSSLLRRCLLFNGDSPEASVLAFEELSIDVSRRQVCKRGIPLKLYRRVGSIIETPAFYENLTAGENLEILTRLRGRHKKIRWRMLWKSNSLQTM